MAALFHLAKLISPSLCLICQSSFCEKTRNLQIEFVVISCSVWELINPSCALQKTACYRVPLLFPLLGLPSSRVRENWWYDGLYVTSFGARKCKRNHCPVLVWDVRLELSRVGEVFAPIAANAPSATWRGTDCL